VIFGVAVFPVVITFGVAGVLDGRHAWQGEQLQALTSAGRCAPVNNVPTPWTGTLLSY